MKRALRIVELEAWSLKRGAESVERAVWRVERDVCGGNCGVWSGRRGAGSEEREACSVQLAETKGAGR